MTWEKFCFIVYQLILGTINSWPFGLIVVCLIFRSSIKSLVVGLIGYFDHIKTGRIAISMGGNKIEIDPRIEKDNLNRLREEDMKTLIHEAIDELEQTQSLAREAINQTKQAGYTTDQAIEAVEFLFKELQETKKAVFFERILRGIKEWEVEILSQGIQSQEINERELYNLIRYKYFPLFDEQLSQQFKQTLTNFTNLGIISIEAGKIVYTRLYYEFARYLKWVQ